MNDDVSKFIAVFLIMFPNDYFPIQHIAFMSARSYEIIDVLLILIADNHWIRIKTAIIYVVTK